MNNEERLRVSAMDHYGVGPDEIDKVLEDGQRPSVMTLQGMGNVAAKQTAKLDLDTEYEAHCVPNGD